MLQILDRHESRHVIRASQLYRKLTMNTLSMMRVSATGMLAYNRFVYMSNHTDNQMGPNGRSWILKLDSGFDPAVEDFMKLGFDYDFLINFIPMCQTGSNFYSTLHRCTCFPLALQQL